MKNDLLNWRVGQPYEYDFISEPIKNRIKRMVFAIVVFTLLIIGIVILSLFINTTMNTVKLSDKSSGVSVKYIDKIPDGITAAANLTSISEADLFDVYDTSIFKAKVVKVKNIEIKFGEMKEYRAITEVKIQKILRGEGLVGDTVRIMLPCAVGENNWTADSNTVARIKEGMTGIFMPYRHDDSSVYKANGGKLFLNDVALYGFPDGVRFVFLRGRDELIFSRQDYPTISDAKTLDEIENYIVSIISK